MTGQIIVLNRWRDRYARYADYLDHDAHRVSYVTTALGRDSVPAGATAAVVVRDIEDLEQVRGAVRGLIDRWGHPERLVALNEGDLITAARLRAELGLPGQHPSAVARFRDKLVMTRLVADAGVRTLAFADAPDVDAVRVFAESHGWPVVVKPRRGTASRGIQVLNSAADLSRLADLPPEPRLVQRFCPAPIYHIDGLWTGAELGPWRASRYVNAPAAFTSGAVLGSVEVDDPLLLAELGRFTAAVAGALSDQPWVFHMEAFADADVAPTFLEVGYRVGGAEIPFLWREVHGVDLMTAAVDVQLGRTPVLSPPATWRTGGWLLVPTPVPAPCEVVVATDPSALADIECLYASRVPRPGQAIPRIGGYEHVGARFRFGGADTATVEKALLDVAARFRLECRPGSFGGRVRLGSPYP
ncbi:biotin carboxylase [Solwaraspora sp. WMMD406]|uniref:ATP-grasp domain-containing protein n=1 Tax=Solwaraspora sp. WMMD406 TaxID=3016095 RepID=UPI002415AF05|nr:biotin carboxylase [Solwaraspora sp. WMMD406]MDG4767451.1 biotin carboxylase [Solwaraspora sp. WMMD406]